MDNSKSLVNIKSLYKDEAKEINKNHNKLYGLMKKGVLIAFEIGKQLVNVQRFLASNDRNAFNVWTESNLEISPATIRNYIKLYDYFYDKPELLNTLTLMEAYSEAGISTRKALPAPCDEEDGKIYTAGLEDDDGSYDEELATIFNRKTRSGIKLENYRVEIYGEELWGFRRGMGRFPVADILFTRPAGLPGIEWQDMQKNVCMAFEAYYAKIEMYENNGKIEAPEDTRFGTMMESKGGLK
nr:hypothetical protein [uncultured Treponema sp.]